ncbi:MAG: 3-ketoacyl-ACP reductase [Propionibacteriaceae bacterium]|jgi:NAD(P)-dependent dehydrogenase (short-subunit alcohol dehydrogenase family)|nr:3-ketoacyl-ACP reductase [Propionibacteriaceae bacterium]
MPVAMVTGGSRGIGFGITRRLVDEGWKVAVMATREQPPEEFAHVVGESAIYVSGHVDDLGSHQRFLDATLAAWGRVDLLVNNAGVAPRVRADILAASAEEFDRVMSINLRGPYFLTQLVVNQMIGQTRAMGLSEPVNLSDTAGAGRSEAVGQVDGAGQVEGVNQVAGTIINVSSISAQTVSIDRGEYCISKAGVAMATQLWAARLAPHGILVYEIRPGVIATDMTAGVKEKYDALFAAGLAPMGRWGQPSDVAGAVLALGSGLMPYSTGDVVNVGGGMQIPRL